jgi:hypothetical protein
VPAALPRKSHSTRAELGQRQMFRAVRQSTPLRWSYWTRRHGLSAGGGSHERTRVTGPTPEITETALFDFPIQNGSPGFNITHHSNVSAPELDFVHNCYYVEITMNENDTPGGLRLFRPWMRLD